MLRLVDSEVPTGARKRIDFRAPASSKPDGHGFG